MLTFEREIDALEARGALDAASAARLRAIERREIFSVHPELRALAWGGVMLVVAGVGVLVSRHLDRIGPAALATALAVVAAGCYAYAARRRRSAAPALLDDYVLLLGALLVSADLGYVEAQLRLLEHGWPRHLLLLAVVHGVGAYAFDSRAVLALSISALAAWMGIEQRAQTFFVASTATALRAFLSAAIVLAWRLADRRLRAARSFDRVFEHFAANLALLGALVLAFGVTSRAPGTLLTLALAGAVIVYGLRSRAEAFVLYAYVYAVLAVDGFAVDHIRGATAVMLYLVVSTIAAIVGLFALHGRYRRGEA